MKKTTIIFVFILNYTLNAQTYPPKHLSDSIYIEIKTDFYTDDNHQIKPIEFFVVVNNYSDTIKIKNDTISHKIYKFEKSLFGLNDSISLNVNFNNFCNFNHELLLPQNVFYAEEKVLVVLIASNLNNNFNYFIHNDIGDVSTVYTNREYSRKKKTVENNLIAIYSPYRPFPNRFEKFVGNIKYFFFRFCPF